jgi:hypothetical protein
VNDPRPILFFVVIDSAMGKPKALYLRKGSAAAAAVAATRICPRACDDGDEQEPDTFPPADPPTDRPASWRSLAKWNSRIIQLQWRFRSAMQQQIFRRHCVICRPVCATIVSVVQLQQQLQQQQQLAEHGGDDIGGDGGGVSSARCFVGFSAVCNLDF